MLGGLVLAAVVSTRWVRVNVSPSTPLGLYRLAPLTLPLPRGTLVLLPVPARVRAWHGKTMPLVKPVAAIAGDTVCVQESSLWIEGERYGPVWREAHGTLLPQWTGCQVIPEGQVFLASKAPNSLDGRYFGSTPIVDLTAQAVPLWMWR